MADHEQFYTFWEDLYDCEEQIVAMGASAIEPLLAEFVRGTQESGSAASMLCQIGIADERVICTMREQVEAGGKLAMWGAKTLGILGDIPWLLNAVDEESTRAPAVQGILGPLGAFSNHCPHVAPLTYECLEALLAKNCPECTNIVEETLAPGCDHRDIDVSEVDEAIRALSSPHPVVRRHAAMVLGGRGFGAAAKKKIAPALVQRFSDEDRQTKRLAVLSLSYLPKSAAKPFREELEALLDDPDLDVILFARRTLEKIS